MTSPRISQWQQRDRAGREEERAWAAYIREDTWEARARWIRAKRRLEKVLEKRVRL